MDRRFWPSLALLVFSLLAQLEVKTMAQNTYSFAICSEYASAIINADYSGLADNEEKLLDNFLNGVIEEIGFGIWDIAHAESEFTRDEVSGLMADCILFFYHVEG
jgi:hypothetical protein